MYVHKYACECVYYCTEHMEHHLPLPSRYLVTHINELQALVIVQHNEGFYNLYLSDQSGVYFSLSLRDIAVVGINTVDLELVS